MIALHDSDGNRLSVTWQGFDFNAPFDQYSTFDGSNQQGIFLDVSTVNTPVNYQSEVESELVKRGGGIEYYNPRVTSRVLNIRGRLQAADLHIMHSYLNYIERLFSPLYLQWQYGGWPPPAGRPRWCTPWDANYQPLKFSTLEPNEDGKFPGMNTTQAMQYTVAPLELPDPPVSAIGTGWGAELDLGWLILDGGVATDQTENTRDGNGTIVPAFSDVPIFPVISATFSGAGASNLTITFTNDHASNAGEGAIVVDASGFSNGDTLVIPVAERTAIVNGSVDASVLSGSTTWPIIAPYGYTTTVAWTNTTNLNADNVLWRETISA